MCSGSTWPLEGEIAGSEDIERSAWEAADCTAAEKRRPWATSVDMACCTQANVEVACTADWRREKEIAAAAAVVVAAISPDADTVEADRIAEDVVDKQDDMDIVA